MQKYVLGKTGLEVTELCFGVLPLGPLQADIPVREAAKLIRTALERGVNFLDTAELYQTYEHIRVALEGFTGQVIIATKSTAETYEGMEKSIKRALEDLERDYIDIFHLHAARVNDRVFEERKGALQCLVDYKKQGLIKAIGISTHSVKAVAKAAEIAEIDVVFPIINKAAVGILDGDLNEMLAAISKAYRAKKGIYAMKALAGGHLINDLQDAINYVRKVEGISSVAVGMINEGELELNLKVFNNEDIEQEMASLQLGSTKKLKVLGFCQGCGTCVTVCPNHALEVSGEKVYVDHSKCLMCGYCNPVCPEFALRIV